MPRNLVPANSTRNRNRIGNKTRLKIYRGLIDADPLLLDEDNFGSNSIQTAGVDAEETNEHHLQAVLSAASKRNQLAAQRTRAGDKPAESVAYIPVPDSTGLVDNYDELYPPGRWKDPITYVATSATVEECCKNALSNGFTYYMDERDKEWLDKNNEEARGEGTSTQGAVSASASGATRVSARSAKAKGKEPESSQPHVISEDSFELVMGIFEKVTHEKTEHLHLSLNTGMAFPAFTEYQETFASPMHPSYFATFAVPTGIPPPALLVRLARSIYPHWKERRLERGGLRIIPALHGDETDTLNESYVCFRRREIKAVRKTRASQVTSSDKLARLQNELSYPLEMAKALLSRELMKKDTLHDAQAVWEKRMTIVDLKRKFPMLGDKADEELLYDKERVIKKPKLETPRLKLRHDPASPAMPTEVAIRPSHRAATIQAHVEREVSKQKDRDHHWEDSLDNAYQQLPVPFASRSFKFIQPSESVSPVERQPRAIRRRYGRGGRTWIDRRSRGPGPRLLQDALAEKDAPVPSPRRFPPSDGSDNERVDDPELARQLASRWKFDEDDYPPTGPNGADENDRTLVDDYTPRHLLETMKLFSDSDLASLMTDNVITVTHPDGRQHTVVPYRLGVPQFRREPPRMPPGAVVQQPSSNGSVSTAVAPQSNAGVNGAVPVALSTQLQLKKIPPLHSPMANHSQGRTVSMPNGNGSSGGGIRTVSADGGMRPPLSAGSSPVVSTAIVDRDIHLSSTTNALMNVPTLQTSPPRKASSPEVPLTTDTNNVMMQPVNGAALVRPKSQNQTAQPNGYHPSAMQTYTNGNAVFNVQGQQGSGLSHQQLQNLKSAFANIPTTQDLVPVPQGVNGVVGRPGVGVPYVQMSNGTYNVQLNGNVALTPKLPPARPTQWGTTTRATPMGINGVSADHTPLVNGTSMSPSPSLTNTVPVRSPSRTGMGVGMRPPGVGGMGMAGSPNRVAHSMSPHLQHSSPSHSISPNTSHPPLPTTPSPSIQHHQAINGIQGGF
ncbi:Enhancer of polycomb-like protein [Pleurotus pulmonarius]